MVDRLLERALVHVELLAEPKVGDEHPDAAVLGRRDEDVLRLDVAVDDLELVEVSDPAGDLAQGAFWFEVAYEVGEGEGLVDEVVEGGGAELESDVEECVALLFTEVADHMGVVVGFLKKGDFVRGDGDEILEKTLDGDSATLELAAKNDRAVRTVTCARESSAAIPHKSSKAERTEDCLRDRQIGRAHV